ncbi:hypothetical protein HAX54_043740, partial [Datura stramonium]|nr:hypothetical protein [Datura stramonium]
ICSREGATVLGCSRRQQRLNSDCSSSLAGTAACDGAMATFSSSVGAATAPLARDWQRRRLLDLLRSAAVH